MPSMPRMMSLWCGAGGSALYEIARDTPKAAARTATTTRASFRPGNRFIPFGALGRDAHIILLHSLCQTQKV